MTPSTMHTSRSAPYIAWLLTLLTLWLPSFAFAQFGLGVVAEIEHIENPLRQPMPEEDELLSSVTVAAQLARETKRFTTQLNYNANRQEYDLDILNDQTLVDGAGSIDWHIVPTYFTWTLANTRSNQLVDISQPDVLDNRQVVDHTSTGPSLTVPLDRASFLNVSARLGLVDFGSFEALKHKRNMLDASYTRRLGQRVSLSVQSNVTDAKYTVAELLNYKTTSIQGQLQFASEGLNLMAALGRQSTERKGFRASSPIRSVDILYKFNTRFAITLAYSDSVEDLLSDLSSPSAVDQSFVDSDIEIDGNFGSTNASNIYQRRERSLGATYSVPSSYSIGLRYSNNDRHNIDLMSADQDERLLGSFSLPIGNRLTFRASLEASEQLFAIDQSTLERTGFRIGVSYKISDRLSFIFSASDYEQENSRLDGDIDGRNIALGLSFTR